MDRSSHRLSVAPMMDRTDRFFRVFLRQISRRSMLYTEMVTHDAALFGDRESLLGFHPVEHPITLQLGGSEPARLAEAAALGEAWGYDEINLNVGCPSDRVQARRFGACLMLDPPLVAECVAAMKARVRVPVTVKHRIGVDEKDSYEDMLAFVDAVAAAGCDTFIVHARKAWLSGLSPRENREIPPLRPADVVRLKRERPWLHVEINGGIHTLEEVEGHLEVVDGVMIGRAVVDTPWQVLGAADSRIFGEEVDPARDPFEVVERFLPFVEEMRSAGHPLYRICRHTHGLFHGMPGSRLWKRRLSEEGSREGAGPEVLERAAAEVREAVRWASRASERAAERAPGGT